MNAEVNERIERAKRTQAIMNHLRYNHYPPMPLEMVFVAEEAIEKAQKELYEDEINLPKEITYKGRNKIKVYEAIESMHLESFVEYPEW